MKKELLAFCVIIAFFTSILSKTKEYSKVPQSYRKAAANQRAVERRIRERENAISRIREHTRSQIQEMGGRTEQLQQLAESTLSQVAALDPHYEINLFISKRPPERAARIFSRLMLSIDGEDVSMERILEEELTKSEMNEVRQIINKQE